MEDVKQHLDCDVYQVEVDKSTGKKVIHIDGFCYFNDEEYQLVQGTFCYMDIDGTQCTEKAQELFENTKQYHGTVSWEEVWEYYKQCTPLPYDEVTQDTPCGFYVNERTMETQVRIKRIVDWVFPYFGNRHTMPYGKLEVTDGKTTKICSTKGDTLETWRTHQCQYITFNRKPYKVCGHISQRGTSTKLYLEPIN